MKVMIRCIHEDVLDGFKFGFSFARGPGITYTQGVDSMSYWLLIEDDNDEGDNQTYWLDSNSGLEHIETGVEL